MNNEEIAGWALTVLGISFLVWNSMETLTYFPWGWAGALLTWFGGMLVGVGSL